MIIKHIPTEEEFTHKPTEEEIIGGMDKSLDNVIEQVRKVTILMDTPDYLKDPAKWFLPNSADVGLDSVAPPGEAFTEAAMMKLAKKIKAEYEGQSLSVPLEVLSGIQTHLDICTEIEKRIQRKETSKDSNLRDGEGDPIESNVLGCDVHHKPDPTET